MRIASGIHSSQMTGTFCSNGWAAVAGPGCDVLYQYIKLNVYKNDQPNILETITVKYAV